MYLKRVDMDNWISSKTVHDSTIYFSCIRKSSIKQVSVNLRVNVDFLDPCMLRTFYGQRISILARMSSS